MRLSPYSLMTLLLCAALPACTVTCSSSVNKGSSNPGASDDDRERGTYSGKSKPNGSSGTYSGKSKPNGSKPNGSGGGSKPNGDSNGGGAEPDPTPAPAPEVADETDPTPPAKPGRAKQKPDRAKSPTIYRGQQKPGRAKPGRGQDPTPDPVEPQPIAPQPVDPEGGSDGPVPAPVEGCSTDHECATGESCLDGWCIDTAEDPTTPPSP